MMTSHFAVLAASSEPRTPVADTRSVAGAVRWTLRAEGLAWLTAALVLFVHAGYSRTFFAMLFLVPDLSLLAYLWGPRVGAVGYNAAHSLLGPLLLGTVAYCVLPAALPYALIWLAHIGFDRALGYGLKYGSAFGHTHLGRVGAARGR